jgi:hypothetical protein
MRPRAAVLKASLSLSPEALDPFAHRLDANSEGHSHRLRILPLNQHATRQLCSTMRRKAGILMDVHSVPSENH